MDHTAVGGDHDAGPVEHKLVLPALTAAVEQDLALTKGSSRAQGTSAMASSKPLSIECRPEYADYPLCDIATPHPNDVCKCQLYLCNLGIASAPFRIMLTSCAPPSPLQCAVEEEARTTTRATSPSASSSTR